MLVLTRRVGEVIVIGHPQIGRILIASIKGDRVRVGVDFPTSIPIVRAELLESGQQPAAKSQEPSEAPL